MTRQLKRKARGERPYFFDDPSVDKVVAMVMGLAGETAVLHDRIDTIERLLERKGLLKTSEIETYEPSAAVATARAAWRENYLSEILRIVEIELEAAATGDTAPYDEAIANVESDATPPPGGRRGGAKKSVRKTTARKKVARRKGAG